MVGVPTTQVTVLLKGHSISDRASRAFGNTVPINRGSVHEPFPLNFSIFLCWVQECLLGVVEVWHSLQAP